MMNEGRDHPNTSGTPSAPNFQTVVQSGDFDVITPSLSRHFSGINAAMEAVAPAIARHVSILATGRPLSPSLPQIPLRTALARLRKPPRRVWHARRNNEMLLGLFLKHVLRYPLLLLWTSAALRKHTWLTRFCYHRMDGLVATTRKAAAFLDRPAKVVYHGVDTQIYRPSTDKAAEPRRAELPCKRNLGLFGRIRPNKGTGDLVSAMIKMLPKFPDWGAVLIGQTTSEFKSFEAGLREQLQTAGLVERVKFVGFIKDSSVIPEWYRALDLVVCASRQEGFGLPCLEAMASGCPVVATTAGAWPEIVGEGVDGWVARADDVQSLAEKLVMAFEKSPEALTEMGRRAREKVVRDFAIEREASGLVAVYRELLANGRLQYG